MPTQPHDPVARRAVDAASSAGTRFVDDRGTVWRLRVADRWAMPALAAMYDDFPPGDRAQGLPPRRPRACWEWLADLFETGVNVVACRAEPSPGAHPVGGHACYVPRDDSEPEYAVFVYRPYQRRGIGRAVSERLVAHARAAGRDALTLVVGAPNQAARSLYRELGFREVDRIAARNYQSTDTIVMRKPLDDAGDAVELDGSGADAGS